MIQLIQADARHIPLADESVDCVVTSPPYWGLRDYGVDGQIGLEQSPEAYVAELVAVFGEVRRVLKATGSLWLNLGDSYAQDTKWGGSSGSKNYTSRGGGYALGRSSRCKSGLPGKNLVGIPWRVALALQAAGWILRNDIIWHKPSVLPENVTDRATRDHEYLFLLVKQPHYYFDHAAWQEDAVSSPSDVRKMKAGLDRIGGKHKALDDKLNSAIALTNVGRRRAVGNGETRNRRTVWTITTKPNAEGHFAAFPEALVEPCIQAGCPADGTVLDPFCGSGTTLAVANRLGRSGIGLELNPEYIEIARRRIFSDVTPTKAEAAGGQKLLSLPEPSPAPRAEKLAVGDVFEDDAGRFELYQVSADGKDVRTRRGAGRTGNTNAAALLKKIASGKVRRVTETP